MNPVVIGAMLLLMAAGTYCFFCPRLNYAIYEPALFHPAINRELKEMAPPEVHGGAVAASVTFASESGKTIRGWFYVKPNAKYTVLFSHGNGGNISSRTDIVELLNKAGTSVLIYDYEGYGASDGTPSVAGICADGLGAYKFLVESKKIKEDQIILYGESLGAAVTTYLAERLPCRAMILQSGFASLHRIATERYPILSIYPETFFPEPHLNNLEILSKAHPPVLIIHGQKDTVVPCAHADSLYQHALAPKKIVVFPETGHSNFYKTAPEKFIETVQSFIGELS
ncbi:MAG: alpha/beta hydrolase [Candidatus Obscuribacterales bacterium]|nr:alpha/beta hydrolase [Candidatus Obscuribacterales bacterium]